MIDHVWSILCNGSSIDSETNVISLFGVLEQITIPANPKGIVKLPINLEIFSLWIRGDEKVPACGKMRVVFCDPNDSCEHHAEMDVDLNNAIIFRTRVRSKGLKLRGPGRYKFVIEFQQDQSETWEKVATIPLLVMYQSPEEGQK